MSSGERKHMKIDSEAWHSHIVAHMSRSMTSGSCSTPKYEWSKVMESKKKKSIYCEQIFHSEGLSAKWILWVLLGFPLVPPSPESWHTAPTESKAASQHCNVSHRDAAGQEQWHYKQQAFFCLAQLDFPEHKALLGVKVREIQCEVKLLKSTWASGFTASWLAAVLCLLPVSCLLRINRFTARSQSNPTISVLSGRTRKNRAFIYNFSLPLPNFPYITGCLNSKTDIKMWARWYDSRSLLPWPISQNHKVSKAHTQQFHTT